VQKDIYKRELIQSIPVYSLGQEAFTK